MSHPEIIDIEQPALLRDYLIRTGRVGGDEPLTIDVLAGGVSNKTVRVLRSNGQGWVLKQALPKLRVAVDWFSDPARIAREAEGLRWLEKILPAGTVPTFVFEDRKQSLLCMAAVPQPHENWKKLLLAGIIELDHVRQFGSILGRMHRVGHERRADAQQSFGDRTFFETLRVEPYYLYAASEVEESRSFLADLVDQTRRRILTVVHGDYSPKNVLVQGDRLVLLDHEVIHFGDPGFDPGFAMTHLLSKAHHLPEHRSRFEEAVGEFWRSYREELGPVPWGDDLEGMAVRHTLGCLLARVAGRSPLEYLDSSARSRQRAVVVKLMQTPPARVDELAETFLRTIETCP